MLLKKPMEVSYILDVLESWWPKRKQTINAPISLAKIYLVRSEPNNSKHVNESEFYARKSVTRSNTIDRQALTG